MTMYYVTLRSEAYEDLEIEADNEVEAEYLALSETNLEDPAVDSINKSQRQTTCDSNE